MESEYLRAKEYLKAKEDEIILGVGYLVDGIRVSPERIMVLMSLERREAHNLNFNYKQAFLKCLEAMEEINKYSGIIEERCDSVATNKIRKSIKEVKKLLGKNLG